jgi:hypothetical protein
VTEWTAAIGACRSHLSGYLGFSRASNRLSWILARIKSAILDFQAQIKRPVILSPVFQGEGPPYFVLSRRRNAAQCTTLPGRFRAFLCTMPGSFALKNRAQDDSTFVGWWKGGSVATEWKAELRMTGRLLGGGKVEGWQPNGRQRLGRADRTSPAILDSRAHQIGYLGFLGTNQTPCHPEPRSSGRRTPVFRLIPAPQRGPAQHKHCAARACFPTHNAGVLRPEKPGSG